MNENRWWITVLVAVIGWSGYGVYKFGEMHQRISHLEEEIEKLPPIWLLNNIRELRDEVVEHRKESEPHRNQ